ncbi:site-specific DNA-methyltransferase [Actinomyces sp.]|uniref:site-specific DNA-methyltransferase n=1 Tax=Actinomyces sp. TaxID=29317 RepID=UPI0026DAA990|nr:DNA methyltransferase [Actinomyces sp.]MDO4899182.1 DNA methyltransferase [Actinomyces sp.]
MERIERVTPDITQENVARLVELFPSVATEVADAKGNTQRAINFDALRELLGDVAEGGRERYQFTWPGKRDAKSLARTPCNGTMRPERGRSVNWDTTGNLYIEGDNLAALKLMRETYAGRIKLIYIDPPYNTGHDFVYDDDFARSREEYDAESGDYDEQGGRLVANLESNGRFHSDWCSMMYPRLLLARDLLSGDGSIFISIDDGELMNVRKICDEIFGQSCFVADISWQRSYSPRNDAKGLPREVEHLVAYGKCPAWIPNRLPRTDEMNSSYRQLDGDKSPWASDNPFAPGAKTHQGMVYAIQHAFTGELIYPPSGRCWTFEQSQMLEHMRGWTGYHLEDIGDDETRAMICGVNAADIRKGVPAIMLDKPLGEAREEAQAVMDEGPWPKFYFTRGGEGGIRRKTYLAGLDGKMPTNFWPCSEVGHTDEAKKGLKALFDGRAPFDTPKPVRLMERILTIASDPDSLVLDFFSGSASMAHAVMQKNAEDGGTRRFILVQIPEETTGEYASLCEIGEERIRRAGAMVVREIDGANRQLDLGELSKPVPDVGFRVLRIDSSNYFDTRVEPGMQTQVNLFEFVDNLKEDRTPDDLLFQVLPAFRIPYSAHIEQFDVDGVTCFNVNEGQLIACFDTEADTNVIERIAQERPIYAVFRDASLADDSAAANFEELFKTYSPDTIRRVI